MNRNHKKNGQVVKGIISLGTILILSSALYGCSLIPEEEKLAAPTLVEVKEIQYKTWSVIKKDMIKTRTVKGKIVPLKEENLFFKDKGGYLKNINVRAGDKVKKGDVLAEIDSDNIVSEIKTQKLIIKRAELICDEFKSKNYDPFEVKKAEMDIEIEKLKLEELEKQLAKSKLIAHSNGTVTSIENIKVGEKINAYETLIVVADPHDIEIEYSNRNLSDFKMGMRAAITYQGKEYEGEVASINDEADSTNKKEPYIRVKFDNKMYNPVLKTDAKVDFKLEERKDVLVVPKNVINFEKDTTYVEILEDGEKLRQYIEIGIEAHGMVEIISGLKEGDKVIQK